MVSSSGFGPGIGTAALIDPGWQQPPSPYHFCLIHERVTGRSSDSGESESRGCRGTLPCSAASLSVGVHPRLLTPFQNYTSGFLLLLLLVATLLIVRSVFAVGVLLRALLEEELWVPSLRSASDWCQMRRAITARNLTRFKTSSAGLKASDMIVLVHKLTQRVLKPPA